MIFGPKRLSWIISVFEASVRLSGKFSGVPEVPEKVPALSENLHENLFKFSLGSENEASKGKFKAAINYYQEAIKIDPQNSTLKKLVDLCSQIKRPDLAEKFTNWFNEYQHSFQENQKAKDREAFKKSEQNQKESK